MRKWNGLGFGIAGGLALAGAAAVAVYRWPITFMTAATRFKMWRNGAASRYTRVCIDRDCYRLHYFVAGQGRPVVLIHGIASSGENWSGVFAGLTQAGYRVYLPDLLGFGRSERPDVDYSIPLQTEVIRAFLDQQGLSTADIVGVSMGGWVALRLALLRPERVGRLMLIDSAGTEFAKEFNRELFTPTTPEGLQELFNVLTAKPRSIPAFLGRDLMRRKAPVKWVIERAMDSMMAGQDFIDRHLHELQMRTLIVWGGEDHLIPLTAAEFLHREIKGSQLQVIPGCGHLVIEECAQQVSSVLTEFLRSTDLDDQRAAETGRATVRAHV